MNRNNAKAEAAKLLLADKLGVELATKESIQRYLSGRRLDQKYWTAFDMYGPRGSREVIEVKATEVTPKKAFNAEMDGAFFGPHFREVELAQKIQQDYVWAWVGIKEMTHQTVTSKEIDGIHWELVGHTLVPHPVMVRADVLPAIPDDFSHSLEGSMARVQFQVTVRKGTNLASQSAAYYAKRVA